MCQLLVRRTGKEEKLINNDRSSELQTKNSNIWVLTPQYFKSKLHCVCGKPIGAPPLVTLHVSINTKKNSELVIVGSIKKHYLKIYLVECLSMDSTVWVFTLALTQVISGPITGMNWNEMTFCLLWILVLSLFWGLFWKMWYWGLLYSFHCKPIFPDFNHNDVTYM